MFYDYPVKDYLAKLRPPKGATLTCPDCQQVVRGLSQAHATYVLAAHREGTCQGKEVPQ